VGQGGHASGTIAHPGSGLWHSGELLRGRTFTGK
jgi:hypothetical protein